MTREWITGVAAAVLLTYPVARGVAQGADRWQLGRFAIDNYAESQIRFRDDTIITTLTGPKLMMTSAQYDMAAPRIQVTARKSGTPARFNLSTATGTGGVRIVVRGPEAGQTTTVTCDNATFTAASPPAVGRVDLRGNVRSVTRGPAFAEPLINQAETGEIVILGPNQINVDLQKGSLRFTPREPAPKPKVQPR